MVASIPAEQIVMERRAKAFGIDPRGLVYEIVSPWLSAHPTHVCWMLTRFRN